MNKYVYELLQEFSRQRSSSRSRSSSRCFSTQDKKETIKAMSPKDKRITSYVLTKINKIQAEKQVLLGKKQKVILWYKTVLDKIMTPLIEYMPSVVSPYHLSKLADFRTSNSLSELSDETNQTTPVHPKCMEEPLPIFIKPEYRVYKGHKKGWKIINRLSKARDSKNELINKYKIWKSKIVRETGNHKKFNKSKGLMVYDLFFKDYIESKVGDLMPKIKNPDEHSNVYDFRYQNEPVVNLCENHFNLICGEELASPYKVSLINRSLDKNLNRNRTIIPKSRNTKAINKTDLITVKNKQYETPISRKKDDSFHIVNAKTKEEKYTKPLLAQRSLHKENRGRSGNRLNTVKPETVKDKQVKRKIVVPSKTKHSLINQPVKNSKLSTAETPGINSTGNSRYHVQEKEEKSEVFEEDSIGTNRFSDTSKLDAGLLQDELIKTSDISTEPFKPGIDSETPDKLNLEMGTSGNIVNSTVNIHAADSKTESAVVPKLGQSEDLCDFKTKTSFCEPNTLNKDSITINNNVGFTVRTEVEQNQKQSDKINPLSKIKPENYDKIDSSKSNFLNNTSVTSNSSSIINSVEKKNLPVENNVLKNTYLVSFEVKEDEAFFKTRSQVVADEIIGDIVDLKVVLDEEKKVREEIISKAILEEPKQTKHTNDFFNVLSNTNNSQSQIKKYLPKSVHRIKDSAEINQETHTEPPINNETKIKNVISRKTNSYSYPKDAGKALEINNTHNIPDDSSSINLGARAVKKLTLETDKVNSTGRSDFNIIPDIKKNDLNETKNHNKNDKYKDIIISVRNILPSGNSSENTLGINKNEIELVDTKTKIKSNSTKNYKKTINELKEIIDKLPESHNEQMNGTTKNELFSENVSRGIKTTRKYLKTSEEKVALKENLDKKYIKKTQGRPDRINLKTIKVVDKIDSRPINEDLRDITGDQLNDINLSAGKGKDDDRQLSNFSLNRTSLKTHESGPHNEQKEGTRKNSNNSNTDTGKLKPLKHVQPSKSSLVIARPTNLKKHKKYPEKIWKSKSDNDIKLKSEKSKEAIENRPNVSKRMKSIEVKKSPSITGLKTKYKSVKTNESNGIKFQQLATDIKVVKSIKTDTDRHSQDKKENHLSKPTGSNISSVQEQQLNKKSITSRTKSVLNMKTIETHEYKHLKRVQTSPETTKRDSLTGTETVERKTTNEEQKSKAHTSQKENNSCILKKDSTDNKNTDGENEKLKIAMEKIIKNSEDSVSNQRKIIKFVRKRTQPFTPDIRKEKILIKTEKTTFNSIKNENPSSEGTEEKRKTTSRKPTLKSTFKDKNINPEAKREETGLQPTGILPRKTIKVRVISNSKPDLNPPFSKSTNVGNSLKHPVQSGVKDQKLYPESKRDETGLQPTGILPSKPIKVRVISNSKPDLTPLNSKSTNDGNSLKNPVHSGVKDQKFNPEAKREETGLQPTGILPRKPIKVRVITNSKPDLNPPFSKSTNDGNSLNHPVESGIQAKNPHDEELLKVYKGVGNR